MQREIDILRTFRASTSPTKSHDTRPASSAEPTVDVGARLLLDSVAGGVEWPPMAPSYHEIQPRADNNTDVSRIPQQNSASRSLDGIHVDGSKIQDCFQL